MNVEPTCRYCMRRLTHRGSRGDVNLCYCHACESEQTFDANARPIEYSFMTKEKNYCLHFWPQVKKFKIVSYKNNNPDKYVLELDICPHNYNPSNMTEERVKTLILFS